MVHSFEALGTKWWITVFEDTPSLDIIFDDIERFSHAFEAKYSRFKHDSQVSILNEQGYLESPDEECQAVFRYGKELYLRTDTHFNFLTGHILEARGYNAEYTFEDNNSDALTPGNPVTDLLISAERIELLHGKVDLGGFGKGYLIDRLAERLRNEHQIESFLINGGGDMYATSDHGKPIPILVEHPTAPKKYLGRLLLMNTGFASSSPFKRIWGPDGSLSHIVSANHTHKVATFVLAKTTADADAFATTGLTLDANMLFTLLKKDSLTAATFDPESSQLTAMKEFTLHPVAT